jgi:fructokinase
MAANALRKKTSAVFTITLGKEGTMHSIGDQIEIIKSIPIQPVDATGAGDAFVGAVLYQLNKRNVKDINLVSMEDWKTIISNANKAGARTCEYMGAMEAFKHLNNSIFD